MIRRPNEVWKKIPGCSRYEASSLGSVRRIGTSIPMKTVTRETGYQTVMLCENNIRRQFYVHRLVLLAFRGPPQRPGLEVRHLDGVSRNNKIANLKWGTRSENQNDRRTHGTMAVNIGAENPSAITRASAEKALTLLGMNPKIGQREIAAACGISQITVSRIKRGLHWVKRI